MYDWRTEQVDVVDADGEYDVELEPAGWDYRVLAPVLAGGIAVIGDPALYACAGDARIADVVVDADEVVVTVWVRTSTSASSAGPKPPVSARVWSPAAGTSEVEVAYDAATGMWEVDGRHQPIRLDQADPPPVLTLPTVGSESGARQPLSLPTVGSRFRALLVVGEERWGGGRGGGDEEGDGGGNGERDRQRVSARPVE